MVEPTASIPKTETDLLERSLTVTARALFAGATAGDTFQRVVDLAVETIDGCDFAGVFFIENAAIVTPAFTNPLVVTLHAHQERTGEGPCLDAGSEGATFYAEDLALDTRWPHFGAAAADSGIRCVLAFPLSDKTTVGALNLYARYPQAFGATDRAKGLIFATLAGLALGAAQEREHEEQQRDHLQHALVTRERIGQAQGILMERERITAAEAFDVLRRASQHLNVKLRDVAQTLVDTGESPQRGGPATRR